MTHEIKITTITKFRPLRAVWSSLTTVAVIGVGVAVDSPAMQWAGFLSLVLIAFAIVAMNTAKDEGLTIEQARKRLDEIEADQ